MATCSNVTNAVFDLMYMACVSNSGTNVNASIEPRDYVGIGDPSTVYWRMRLQRREGERWNTVGSRTGYLSPSSPSFRTFTNVASPGRAMRLWVEYYSNSGRTNKIHDHRLQFFR